MTWLSFAETGYQPKEGDVRILHNDRGTFVGEFDAEWCPGGHWMISDGKNHENPLRGEAPTHFMAIPIIPKPQATPEDV